MAEKTVVESVTMTDGRTIEFAGKRRMKKTSFVKEDGTLALQIDFRNGETRVFDLNPDQYNNFAMHGAEQKYGDEVVGSDKDGNPLDYDDMILALEDLHERLSRGEWGIKREASGLAGASLTIKALIEIQPNKTPAEVKAWYTGKTKEQQAAIRASSKVAPVIARLKEEKKTKTSVDTDSLFAELE